MIDEERKSKAVSVRAKLLALATKTGVTFGLLAQRYAVERLLVRLQRSPRERTFVPKGAILLAQYLESRPSRTAAGRRSTSSRSRCAAQGRAEEAA